jgi:hypothetical protein
VHSDHLPFASFGAEGPLLFWLPLASNAHFPLFELVLFVSAPKLLDIFHALAVISLMLQPLFFV